MAEQPNPVQQALGWIFIVLGGLWTLFAGGCTLFGLVALLVSNSSQTVVISLPSILATGAISVAPGALMLWGGLAILRRRG